MRQTEIEKAKTYGRMAMIHAKRREPGTDLPTIKPGMPEWKLWERYFLNHLKFEPVQMRRVRNGLSQEMTVPAVRPEDFDASYRPAISYQSTKSLRDFSDPEGFT